MKEKKQKDLKLNHVKSVGKRVLIVDDDEGIMLAVSFLLSSEGYEIETAVNGDFLETLKERTFPDLIILDVLLSGVDGRDICKKLKSNIVTKNIPVLMFSAHPSVEKTVRKAGADAFIQKPFETDEFLTLIAKLLNKK